MTPIAAAVISEILDFDAAVGAALDFARRQERTLTVVTSDHETGGFAIHDGSIQKREVSATAFTAGGHTASMVPLFADGPSSSNFSGILDNTRMGQIMIGLITKRKIKE